MNKQRLFVASCISLATTSMSFVIRGDIAPSLAATFHVTNEQIGLVFSPAFWAFGVAMVAGGAVVDHIGMRALHVLSALGYLTGIGMVILAPYPDAQVASLFAHPGTTLLYVGFLIMGLSQGLVEAVINPLTVSVYPHEKTKRLTMLHAWWPGGTIIGGLLAAGLTTFLDATWQVKLSLIAIPAVVYFFMALTTVYPQTERVTSNVSTGEMWQQAARPLFLVLFVCNGLWAAAELGSGTWFPTVMGELVPGLQGVLFLVYTSGLMFLVRSFGGLVAQKSPIGTLIGCSLLTFIGLYWLGSLQPGANPAVAFLAATILGFGMAFFSPTITGVTGEQLPRGGAVVLALLAGAGMLSASFAVPMIGARIDRLGGAAALQTLSWLGAILAAIMTLLWIYFRSRGGYKAVRISPADASH